MAADDEVCAPVIYDPTPQGRALAREAADAHADIGEMISETSLKPAGSPLWWQLVHATLAAWSRQSDYEEHDTPAGCLRRADPVLRHQLARQWRAFREARVRDLSYPDAPPHVATCQLRRARPRPPRPCDPTFSALACTCHACTGQLADVRLAS